jgi:putative proteasome-type protease
MTYCVGMQIDRGLLFMTDTRTNSGVDNVSVFRKMHQWSVPGERVITVLTAGNLATTQSVVSLLDERTKVPEERNPSILEVQTMFQVAELIGGLVRDTIDRHLDGGQRAEAKFNATLIVGGQIAGMPPRVFLIYPEGNFIEASADTPFMQIGETKYGRPILLRAYDPTMSFEDAVKLLLVSFDSTIKANLSVGAPLDVSIYETDSLEVQPILRIEGSDEYFRSISDRWSEELRRAFQALPDFDFDKYS